MPRSLSGRRRIVAVLCGGFCGTITRFVFSTLISGWLGKSWPYDILLINVTGALFLAFVTVLADATFLVGPTRRLFINVGFLGAYTTFGSLALGDILLFGGNHWLPAMLYLILSILGGVLAVQLGDWLGQWCISKVRRSTPRAKSTQTLKGMLSGLPVHQTTNENHLDIQDDFLLPDVKDEHKSRQRRS